jgi:hypothetical protein
MAKTDFTPDTLKLIEFETSYHEDNGEPDCLIAQHEQDIPDWFLDHLKEERHLSSAQRAGEFHLAASIPEVFVHELRRRYNFDVLREPLKETLKMLRKLHLDLFIATNKRV